MEAVMSAALVVRGLEMRHQSTPVLRGVNIDVAPGEVCVLLGVSGAGKTSVLRAIAALQPFHAGTITAAGFTLRPGPLQKESRLGELRSKVGMVFQAHSLFEHLTVIENITLAPVNVLGWSVERANDAALALLASLGIADRAGALPREISGGQAQRAAIARALALDPLFLLLDEPTSALDPARRGALARSLRDLAKQGRGLLISTHDVAFTRDCADRAVVLASGVVVEEGDARAVLDRPRHQATRDLLRSENAMASSSP
jgi:ABC-type polar amino acid transport system ATPase subunit